MLIDVYALSRDHASHPGDYGLTNVTDTACDLSAEKNPLSSALTCTTGNLVYGDASHYAFADGVHLTPYNNALLARHVADQVATKGW